MVTLISDGGQMTVGRRLASHVWGQFSVTLPEGEKQKDPDDDRIVDGYVYRPDDAGRGRGELTFMRADAKLDMNASRSDLEATLDGASRRTEGDVFYSREISGLGLGRAVPGVDYTVGDVVSVLVWGRRLTLPVTAVTAVSDTSGGAPWRVQVGGQVLRDAAALRKRNDDLQAQIAVEKRQRLRQVGTVDRKATRAQGTADKAAERASELQKFLSGSDGGDLVGALDAINKQLAAQEEPAASGLVPAYLRINAQLWEAQQLINEQQKLIDAAQTSALEAQRKAVEAQAGLIGFEHFRNHGEFYITPLIEKSNISLGGSIFGAQTYVFNFDGVSGTPVGCRSVRRDGKGMVEILESGVWEFRARVRLRGAVGFSEGDFAIERYSGSSGGGYSPTLVGTNGSGTYEWSGVREMRRGDVVCVTVSSMASSFMGMFGGPAWTLLMCRQISRS